MRQSTRVRATLSAFSVAALLVALPSVAVGAPDTASYTELTDKAKEHRAAGRHDEAAHAFAAAFDKLSDDEKRGLMGEITISNAMDDYRKAQEASPKSVGLLFQEASLLERYGDHIGGLPDELQMELERVKAIVDELHREEEEHRAEQRLAENERKAKERLEAEKEEGSGTGEKLAEPEMPPPESPPSRQTANVVILGAGVASFVGGTALVAAGARNIRHVEQRRGELLAELDANQGGTQEMRNGLLRQIEDWRDQWRRIGTGMAVTGGALIGVGIGLAVWGAASMRSNKDGPKRASVFSPTLSENGAGISLAGKF